VYQVSIFNNGVETLIHVPNPSKEAPHILALGIRERLSQAEMLSLSISYDNPGYDKIRGLNTKVKVYDTRDNSIIFSGRVIPTKDGMGSDGSFINQVTCEGAMNYLIDSNTRRWHFENQTPYQILEYLLYQHNLKVTDDRKIHLGTVELTQPITIDTNYESTLNAIVRKIKNVLGGDLRVQERSGQLFLDYLIAQGANNNVEIRLRYNLKEIIREYDPTDVITRVIPLGYGEGINQLDITKVNNEVDYIEDSEAIAQYGVIEDVITNKDIQNADTLKIYGQTVLNEKKQPKFSFEQTAIDLSVLPGHENEKYELGDTLKTLVDVMNLDVYSRVIERERDLLNAPWNPKLIFSTRPITLTDQIIDLKQRNLTLENAPQGSTCIFALSKAENADAEHPVEFDLDIPKETININRVYLNVHGRKYRAYEKAASSGGSGALTSESGGGVINAETNMPEFTLFPDTIDTTFNIPDPGNDPNYHYHEILVTALAHSHKINLPSHKHNVTLPNHAHGLEYGIYESTCPKSVKIKVNGIDVGLTLGDGNSAFDQLDIDITDKVAIGNNKIEISTAQNGRIDAIVYSQIFIQAR
jgi:phage minor structural protein